MVNNERRIKGSNLPSININKQSLLLLNRLDGDEIKIILKAIQEYVYKGEESKVDEELEIVLDSILDNIENIAISYLNKVKANRENGKKGGRPRTSRNTKIEANTEFDNENNIIPQTVTESPSEGQETPKNEVKNEAPNEVITTSPEIFNNDDDDKDFRYGEIDTTNPMVSFLRDDEPEKDNKINKKIDNKKDKKDMDYTEVAKGYIEQMDGITFNSPEWHQKLISIIKENEPHLRWGAIYETANRIMQNAA